MSHKLTIIDNQVGITMNVRYEKLDTDKKPVIKTTVGGMPVSNKTVLIKDSSILSPGTTRKAWVDKDGAFYNKDHVEYHDEQGEPLEENSQTKVMQIESMENIHDYNNKYVISKFYEVFADDNGMTKDIDRTRAIISNNFQMHKLWVYLKQNHLVARGEFMASSRGFVASDGYIRAVEIDNKWGLEIGVFKECKTFNHLNDGVPVQAPVATAKRRVKRI
jgi:hypothetical protein